MNNRLNIKIGCHIGLKAPNYLVDSINEAISYGANAMMIYTGPPQSSIRVNINKLKINEFRKILDENNWFLDDVIIHAPYIINLANNDIKKRKYAIDIITNEVKRTAAIGAKHLVIHPGNAVNCSLQEGIKNISECINEIIDKTKDLEVIICLETMSGKGTEIGAKFEELANIINLVINKNRIGICLDTCHINDSGYDLTNIDNLFRHFEQSIPFSYLKVIHLNDSKNIKGSKKDRHENIGYGTIGFNNLLNFVYHPKLINIVKILETPWYDNQPIYKQEIKMIKEKKWWNIISNL